MADQLFLIALNTNGAGKDVNYDTSRDEWEHILATAQARGWNPMGTILDFEFHYQLEASRYGQIDQNRFTEIAMDVLEKCRNWHGGYHTPEYQVVTDEDTQRLGQALYGTDVALGFLRFISLGAFRIAG